MPYWLVGGIVMCIGACGDTTKSTLITDQTTTNTGVATVDNDTPTTVESVFYPTPTCQDCISAVPQKQVTPNAR